MQVFGPPGRAEDPNLLVGFRTMDDAAVYKLTDQMALVQTVDFIPPVVDDPFVFGQIAAANSISDIYAMGGRPLTALNICNFPTKGIQKSDLAKILEGGFEKAREAGVAIVGGHTIRDHELKYGLAVTGIIDPKKVVTNAGARPGDKIILTKPIGTGVLIQAYRDGKVDDAVMEKAVKQMVTLNKTASELMQSYRAHACTDVTGFGLLGHLFEVAHASHVSITLNFAKIPCYLESIGLIERHTSTGVTAANREMVQGNVTFDETIRDAEQWLLYDPQTSGGLLIFVAAESAAALLRDLHEAGVKDAQLIGQARALEGQQAIHVANAQGEEP